MQHVDALSRYPGVMTVTLETGVINRIRNAQKSDADSKLIMELFKNGEHKNCCIRNDLVYRFINGGYVLYVPKIMQREIIRNVHELDHSAARKVEIIINKDYDTPDLKRKVKSVIDNCVACILATKKLGKQEGFLNPIEKVDVPLHTYHIDHLGPLPSTAKSYKYVLAIIDAFTKFVWIYTVKSTTCEEVISKLELQREVFGDPFRIITDKGTAFTANDFKTFCERGNIQHITITTGVPRGNGQIERIHNIIIPVLTRMSVNDPLKWYKHTSKLQMTLN